MKINNNIKVENLKVTYDVVALGPVKFKEALKDGTILSLIKANADEATGGDPIPVIDQLLRNNSSFRTNYHKKATHTTGDVRVAEMVGAYDTWLKACKAEAKETRAALGTGTGTGARSDRKWYEYTWDEIQAMDQEKLRNVKNCMASYQSKVKSHKTEDQYDEKDRLHSELYFDVCDLYSKRAREAKAAKTLGIEATPKVELTPELKEKLAKASATGKTAVLSKAHVEELIKLLDSLNG